ncbi:MAG: hypothetical protein ACRDTC_28550 [Pseudonocardiaceae bacterium]
MPRPPSTRWPSTPKRHEHSDWSRPRWPRSGDRGTAWSADAEVDPAALALVRIGAFLAPEPIPADILTRPIAATGDSRPPELNEAERLLSEAEPARQDSADPVRES